MQQDYGARCPMKTDPLCSRRSREEIQTMLQVHDIRETRVYQEGLAEGSQEERQRSLQEKIAAISKLAARQVPAADIADVLGLDLELVLKTLNA